MTLREIYKILYEQFSKQGENAREYYDRIDEYTIHYINQEVFRFTDGKKIELFEIKEIKVNDKTKQIVFK